MDSCTLTSLARAARLGVSTVSYALRDSPKIPPVTRDRVKRLADQMGYRPHPTVAALMAHVKAGRQPIAPTKIAFVWTEQNPASLNTPFNRQSIAGARRRAQERGYQLDEFRLFERGMTSTRLSQMLRARGITGVVFSGCESSTSFHLEMNWAWHSAAIIGNARCTPELHRAGHHHFLGMRRIMSELDERGYRRPVAVLESVVNERASRTHEAAFLAYHPAPSRARAALIQVLQVEPAVLRPWLKKQRPDVIIVSKHGMIAPIRKLLGAAGATMSFVVISIEESLGTASGVDPGHEMVAANAVDLVIGQMLRNETGIPEHPKELLFAGHWVEGSTLRPQPRGAAVVMG
ncbi:MAG TPA: LacI family DNA-binding transcriptional regulator [Opitutaceae bacterium]|nr:LacI family DNA-binding transcriptional regulator [Opitutaceae bacterium]